jgi:hypothetical protein
LGGGGGVKTGFCYAAQVGLSLLSAGITAENHHTWPSHPPFLIGILLYTKYKIPGKSWYIWKTTLICWFLNHCVHLYLHYQHSKLLRTLLGRTWTGLNKNLTDTCRIEDRAIQRAVILHCSFIICVSPLPVLLKEGEVCLSPYNKCCLKTQTELDLKAKIIKVLVIH